MDGYESYFGLNEAPFSLAPDPRFLFASASHSDALGQVSYALERREPLVVVTGEIGTGKTLLCRTVLQQLRRKTFLSVISDPLLDRDDMLKQLLQDFGIISKDRTKLTDTTRHELTQALHEFLRSLVPIQAHAVVMIDEAQHLQPDVLEQIRLLSNADDERGTLLEIILVGQPGLETLLSRPELQQLQQRVSRRIRLEPLNRAEVRQYVEHRLALARQPRAKLPGSTELAQEMADWAGTNAGVEFAPDAMQALSDLSGGLPRVINLLCDRSLEEAFASRLRVVDRPLLLAAARALGLPVIGTPANDTPAASAAATSAAPTSTPATTAPATARSAPVDATVHATPVEPDKSFWAATRPESAAPKSAVHSADDAGPLALAAGPRPAAAPRVTMWVVVAASVAFGAVAIWLGLRAARPDEAPAPRSVTAPGASAPLVLSPRPETVPEPAATTGTPGPQTTGTPAPQTTRTPVPQTAGTPVPQATKPPPSPPQATSAAPAAAPAAATGGFDIVVASFRTEGRASSVAAEVQALGLPIRRRLSDGWYQLISGPFKSRTSAEDAQQRLQRAGLAGTQIVAR